MWNRLDANIAVLRDHLWDRTSKRLYQLFSPAGDMSASAPSGLAVLLTGGMLVLMLGMIYLTGL